MSYDRSGQEDMNRQPNRPDIPDFYRKKSRRQGTYDFDNEITFVETETAQSPEYGKRREKQMEKPKKGRGIRSFFIGFAVVLILISAGIFSAYYAYNHIMGDTTEQYVKSLSQINKDINTINGDTMAVFEGDDEDLPADNILAKTSESYKGMNSIIEKVSKITPPSKYRESHNKLTQALEQNKSIYRQLELVFKNPADPETDKNMEALAKSINDAMTSYTAISVEGLSFSLPDAALSLPQKIQPWVDKKQAEYAKVMSLIEDFTQYFNSISKVLLTYDSAETNFSGTITSIRSGQESWDSLFSKIEESEAIIKGAITEYGKISVPSQLKSFNSKFGSVLDDLMTYYSQLKLAAATERDFVTEYLTDEELALVKEEINKLYQDAEKYRNSSSQNYQAFASDMNILKGKYLDPEYVIKLKK